MARLPGARPVWLPTLAAVLVAGLTAMLGQWQWRKAEVKEAARTSYEQAAALPAMAWREAGALGEAALYRRVRVTGEFSAGYQILLDNRVQAGRAGYHVVLPMRMEQGGAVLVNRGWLAAGGDRSHLPAVAVPDGRQTIEGILVHARSRYLELIPPGGTGALWQNLDLDRYCAWAGLDLPDWLLLQTGSTDDDLARDWPGPDTGAARHRAYAVQWFSLCALTVGLWGWFAVWRRRAVHGDDSGRIGCSLIPSPSPAGGRGLVPSPVGRTVAVSISGSISIPARAELVPSPADRRKSLWGGRGVGVREQRPPSRRFLPWLPSSLAPSFLRERPPSPHWPVRLVYATALLALLVVALGAYVRLSDAGLGCPDWPGCYGQPTPHHAADAIEAAHAAWPEGPVSPAKAWKEMVHRYLASLLGLAILVIAWRAWRRPGGVDRRVALALAVLVVCQGLLGMWTVTLVLKPVVVSAHLLGGMATFSLLVWLAAGRSPSAPPPSEGEGRATARERGQVFIHLALLAVILQIALGGWVSSNYAAVACTGFPTCNDAGWPAADWLAAFRPDRELGLTAHGGPLGLDALVAIHWAHRLGALLTALAVGWLGWRLLRVGHGRSAWLLLGLLGVQVGLGIANVLAGLPLAVAVAHNLGAALLLATLVWLHARTRRAA